MKILLEKNVFSKFKIPIYEKSMKSHFTYMKRVEKNLSHLPLKLT